METPAVLNSPVCEDAPCFPPELVDAVVKELHPALWDPQWPESPGSKQDLHACSLVCRLWNGVARPHLFRDISFSFQRHRFTGLAASSPPLEQYWRIFCLKRQNVRHKTLEMLLCFLQASPSVSSCVRRLKLDMWPDILFRFNEDNQVDSVVFNEILQRLPRLQVLHLCNILLKSPILSNPYRSAICRLHIVSYGCYYSSGGGNFSQRIYTLSDLNNILAFFTSIDELQLSQITMYSDVQDGDEHPELGPNPIRVKSLILGGTSSLAVPHFDVIAERVDVRYLRRITVMSLQETGQSMPLVSRTFLRRAGKYIRQY